MINWLANRYNKSFDTTSNKRFSLSEQTQKIVKDLKGDATVAYIDRTAQFDQAKGMLDRYANLSPKIHVKYIDFAKNPTVARLNLKFPGTAYVKRTANARGRSCGRHYSTSSVQSRAV